MPKFKNAFTGRVVEVPDAAPGLFDIDKSDNDETVRHKQKLNEVAQAKHDRTLSRMRASKRWEPTSERAKPASKVVTTASDRAKNT